MEAFKPLLADPEELSRFQNKFCNLFAVQTWLPGAEHRQSCGTHEKKYYTNNGISGDYSFGCIWKFGGVWVVKHMICNEEAKEEEILCNIIIVSPSPKVSDD